MPPSESTHKFSIVKFINELNNEGKPVVDIVPKSWIRFHEGSYFCSYPPKPYNGLITLVKRLTKPDLLWEEFLCEELGTAETYEIGMMLVRRALTKLSVNTTDDESDIRMSSSHIVNLSDIPPFPGEDTGAHSPGYVPEDESDEEVGSRKRGLSNPTNDLVGQKKKKLSTPGNSSKSEQIEHTSSQQTLQDASSFTNKYLTKQTDIVKETIKNVQGSKSDNKTAVDKASDTVKETAINDQSSKSDNDNTAVTIDKVYQYLHEMDKKFTAALSKTKKTILHDVRDNRTSIKTLASSIDAFMKTEGHGYTPISEIDEFERKHLVSGLPMNDIEQFKSFNCKIDENPNIFEEFRKILSSLWVPVHHKQTMTRSLTSVLERYLTKEIALQYSAQGKGRKKKLDFSALPFYRALEAVIQTVQAYIQKKDILEELGKVLAKAGDWHGGRVERRLAAEKKVLDTSAKGTEEEDQDADDAVDKEGENGGDEERTAGAV